MTRSDAKDVRLPVLGARLQNDKIRRSRMGRRRAIVLALVHVIIVAHIIQWLITGLTLSPVEPSESMYTLETGVVNAGFVLFVAALLATLVMGRFFCGWACHVVALQDSCTWIMNRLGMRPRPFRSRLLVYVPLGLALYMFVWPTFKRLALAPILEALGVSWPHWLQRVGEPDRLMTEFLVQDFWATFPPWYIAVPFLLICGFVAVYFLGSKGFCTYGCPYGGFFAPADRLAPVRVRVTDACQGCGHCTAVCNANVRVHEEVRDFGMVVDPGCMKHMDCVSVCPNDALFVGLGRPAIGARPRNKETLKASRAKRGRRYDLSWPEEILCGAVFLVAFMAFRGMLDAVPMLMAAGMAAISSFLVWKGIRLARDRDVRLQRLKLRTSGKLTRSGVVFCLSVTGLVAVGAWSGIVRFAHWRSSVIYASFEVPGSVVFRPEFVASAETEDKARRGVAWLELAGPIGAGGLGWSLSPESVLRLAYFASLIGEFDQAERHLKRVIETGNPTDRLVLQLLQIQQLRGAPPDELEETMSRAIEVHPHLDDVRARLASLLQATGRTDESNALWSEQPESVAGALRRARFELQAGRRSEAIAALDRASALQAESRHRRATTDLEIAELALAVGDRDRGVGMLERASLSIHDGDRPRLADLWARSGDRDQALAVLDDLGPDARAQTALAAGLVLMGLGERTRAVPLFDMAIRGVEGRAWEQIALGSRLIQIGQQSGNTQILEMGFRSLDMAIEGEPGAPLIWHDRATALAGAGRLSEGADSMVRAAELGAASAILAQRAADLLRASGRVEESQSWAEQALSRSRDGG